MCLGIPGKIIEITHHTNKLAMVDVMGVRREINMACIVSDEHPVGACVGDWVLVHVGFAMSRIDENEARLTLEALQRLGEAQNELQAMRDADAALAMPAHDADAALAMPARGAAAHGAGPLHRPTGPDAR